MVWRSCGRVMGSSRSIAPGAILLFRKDHSVGGWAGGRTHQKRTYSTTNIRQPRALQGHAPKNIRDQLIYSLFVSRGRFVNGKFGIEIIYVCKCCWMFQLSAFPCFVLRRSIPRPSTKPNLDIYRRRQVCVARAVISHSITFVANPLAQLVNQMRCCRKL